VTFVLTLSDHLLSFSYSMPVITLYANRGSSNNTAYNCVYVWLSLVRLWHLGSDSDLALSVMFYRLFPFLTSKIVVDLVKSGIKI